MSYPELPSGINANWEDTGTVHFIYNISPFIGENTATEAVLTYAGSPAVTITGHQARGVYGGTIRILFSGTIGVGASAPVVAWRITNWDTTRFPFYNTPPLWVGNTKPVESDTFNSLVPSNADSLVVGGGTGRNFRLFRTGTSGRITTINYSSYNYPATTENPFTIVSSNGERNGTAWLTLSGFLWGVFPNLTPGRTYTLTPTISQESFATGTYNAPVITGRLNHANPQITVPALTNTTTLAATANPSPPAAPNAITPIVAPSGSSIRIDCVYGDGTTQAIANALINCVRITATLLNTPPRPAGSPPQNAPTAIAPITLYYLYNLVNTVEYTAYIGGGANVPTLMIRKYFPSLPVNGTYLFQVSFGATGDYDSYYAGGGYTYPPPGSDPSASNRTFTTPPPNTIFGAPRLFTYTWTSPFPITVLPPVPTVTAIDGGLVDVTAFNAAIVNTGAPGLPAPYPSVTLGTTAFRFQYSLDGGATFTSVDSTSVSGDDTSAQLSLTAQSSYLIRSAARNPTADGTAYQVELFSDWIEVDTEPATALAPPSPVDSATAYSGNSTNNLAIIANAFTGGAGVKTYRINWLFQYFNAPAPLPALLTNVSPILYSNAGIVSYTILSAATETGELPADGSVPQLSPWKCWWTLTATDETGLAVQSGIQEYARAAQTTPNAPNEIIPAAVYGGLVIPVPGAQPTIYRMVFPPDRPNPQVAIQQSAYVISQSFWSVAEGNTPTMGFVFKAQTSPFGLPPFPGVPGQPELGGFVDFLIPTGGVVDDVMETQIYPRTYAQTATRSNFPASPVFTPNSYALIPPGNGLRTPSLQGLINVSANILYTSVTPNTATAGWDLGSLPPHYAPSPGDPDENQGIGYSLMCQDFYSAYPAFEVTIASPGSGVHLTSTALTNLVPFTNYIIYPKILYDYAGGVFSKSATRATPNSVLTQNPTFVISTYTFTPSSTGFTLTIPYVQPGGTNPVAGSSTGSTASNGDTYIYLVTITTENFVNVLTSPLSDTGGTDAGIVVASGLTSATNYYYFFELGTAARPRNFRATTPTLFTTL